MNKTQMNEDAFSNQLRPVSQFMVLLVMETPRPSLMSSDSDLYNGSAGLIVSNQSKNNADDTGQTFYILVIAIIEFPVICLAIYAACSLIKSKREAPVFVLNLLISDLIFIVCSLLQIRFRSSRNTFMLIATEWTCATGMYFMTCIAVERYVMIAHPIWHRTHRSFKCLVCSSLTGWIVSLIVIPIYYTKLVLINFIPFIFYPVIILCFVGACRSLSRSITLTPVKKQLVLAPLFFVVISYTFLILPLNIVLIEYLEFNNTLGSMLNFTSCLFLLNPLVDCLLYVFMRSDSENIIRMPHCCTRLKRVQSETRHTTSTNVQHDHV